MRKPGPAGATVFNNKMGSHTPPSTDNYTNYSVTLTTAYANKIYVRQTQDAPSSGDYLIAGMDKDTGPESIEQAEIWGFVLTDQPPAPGGFSDGAGRGVGEGVMRGVG